MNRADIMRQTSLEVLLDEYIKHEPGCTSEKLWKVASEWDHELLGLEFDRALTKIRGIHRCTNKQWYPIGHVAQPKRKGPSKEDPRQTRMFG